jgi:hypothetical protein
VQNQLNGDIADEEPVRKSNGRACVDLLASLAKEE